MAAKDAPQNEPSTRDPARERTHSRRTVVKGFGAGALAGAAIVVLATAALEKTALPKNIRLTENFKALYPVVAKALDETANLELPRTSPGQRSVALATWAKRESNLLPNKVGGTPDNPTYGLYQFSAKDLSSGTLSEYGLNTPEDALDPVKASKAAARMFEEYNNGPDGADLAELPSHGKQEVALEKTLDAFEKLVSQGLIGGPGLKIPRQDRPLPFGL